jgi:hypothetical protein
MIVTHTRNATGQQRVYVGGKSSLECWIEPAVEKHGWTFHIDAAVTGNQIDADDKRAWAIHILLQLAAVLDVAPEQLSAVPFEAIAALHVTDPYAGRRVATPRRQAIVNGFMATTPDIRRPAEDFRAHERDHRRRPAR